MNDVTIPTNGGVECRICGLRFIPDSPDDQRTHREEHQMLIGGGLPLKIREFLKAFGWAIAHNDGGLQRLSEAWSQEIGKRAVAFSWWTRARSKGIPDREFEPFMAAHLAYIDAIVAKDQERIAATGARIEPWGRYAG